jgi:hypothetical protein
MQRIAPSHLVQIPINIFEMLLASRMAEADMHDMDVVPHTPLPDPPCFSLALLGSQRLLKHCPAFLLIMVSARIEGGEGRRRHVLPVPGGLLRVPALAEAERPPRGRGRGAQASEQGRVDRQDDPGAEGGGIERKTKMDREPTRTIALVNNRFVSTRNHTSDV